MDVGDVVVGGLVIGGAYVAYRCYRDHQAASAAPGTPTGAAAASMTNAAARVTTFGNFSFLRRLLLPQAPAPMTPVLPAQTPATIAAPIFRAAAATINLQVARAAAAPAANAPAYGNPLLVPVIGLRAPSPTQPTGDAPQPGDPRPAVFLRGLR